MAGVIAGGFAGHRHWNVRWRRAGWLAAVGATAIACCLALLVWSLAAPAAPAAPAAAGAPAAARAPRRPAAQQVRPSVRRILDSMTTTPAYVRNARLDVLATNRLAAALFAPILTGPAQPANNARFLFLDPAAPAFYPEWERQAQDVVAMLRTEAGQSPHDKALSNLIGELSTRSEHFRTWWAAHNVRFHRTGTKRFHHPVVGDLTLTFEALDLAADSGLRISAYSAEPGTPSDDALKLLATWAATMDQAAPAADGG